MTTANMDRIMNLFNVEVNVCANKHGDEILVTWAEYDLAVECDRLRQQLEDQNMLINNLHDWCQMLSKRIRALEGSSEITTISEFGETEDDNW